MGASKQIKTAPKRSSMLDSVDSADYWFMERSITPYFLFSYILNEIRAQ